jgi:hypothetical protein
VFEIDEDENIKAAIQLLPTSSSLASLDNSSAAYVTEAPYLQKIIFSVVAVPRISNHAAISSPQPPSDCRLGNKDSQVTAFTPIPDQASLVIKSNKPSPYPLHAKPPIEVTNATPERDSSLFHW